MMIVHTEPGKTYTVVSTAGGSVITLEGTPVKTLVAGQDYFTAVSSVTVISDDEAIVQEVFKSAPIGGSGGGGGASITFDATPTKDSTNAVTSGGVWTATRHAGTGNNSIAMGKNSDAGLNAVAMGPYCKSTGGESVSFGSKSNNSSYGGTVVGAYSSCSSNGILSIGNSAHASGAQATVLGSGAQSSHVHAFVIGTKARSTEANSIVLSARSSVNTKFVLSLVAGTATGDAGSILSDTPFVSGSTIKLTVSDGVSGISETLSIDAADLFTLLQSAGGTVTLTNPNA